MANGAIDWDDEVSSEDIVGGESQQRDDFVVLPEGEYRFTVNKVERGTFSGSDKLPPCNKVTVGMIVDGGDKGRSFVNHRFFMHTKCLWQIYGFLGAIGLHTPGDKAGAIPWNRVTKGLTGYAKFKIHTYNDKSNNEVDRWISRDEHMKAAPEDLEF